MSNFILGEAKGVSVAAVNRTAGTVVTDGGEIAPVVAWLDECGDDCEGAEAVVCVAGPIAGKTTLTFITVDLREFEPVTFQ